MMIGCASSEPAEPGPEAADDGLITVAGTAPSVKLFGRAEPAQPGVCHADRLLLWLYQTANAGTSSVPSISALSYKGEYLCTDLTSSSNNRTTSHQYSLTVTGARRNSYGIRGLAYTEADKDLFTATPGGNPTEASLSLNIGAADANAETSFRCPELFWGNPYVDLSNYTSAGSVGNHDFHYCYRTPASNLNLKAQGKIYRLVSQYNMIVENIPAEVVKLELLATHYPYKVNLYGNGGNHHGTYYPNGWATVADCQGNQDVTVKDEEDHDVTVNVPVKTIVATVVNPSSKESLSTYLLPSEVSMALTMRVHYRSGKVKDFPVLPEKSVYMTGQESVYTHVPAALKKGDDANAFYIYDGVKQEFYSYSNVRVNIRADFDNVAAETTNAEIVIEVEPSFAGAHVFDVS